MTKPKRSAVTNRILELVKREYHGNWTEFRKAAGIAATTGERWLYRGGTPKEKSLRRIGNATGYAFEWLKRGTGPMWSAKTIREANAAIIGAIAKDAQKVLDAKDAPLHREGLRNAFAEVTALATAPADGKELPGHVRPPGAIADSTVGSLFIDLSDNRLFASVYLATKPGVVDSPSRVPITPEQLAALKQH